MKQLHTLRFPMSEKGTPAELIQKLETLLHHWMDHNHSHAAEYEKWVQKATEEGLRDVGTAIEKAGVVARNSNRYLQQAIELLQRYKKGTAEASEG